MTSIAVHFKPSFDQEVLLKISHDEMVLEIPKTKRKKEEVFISRAEFESINDQIRDLIENPEKDDRLILDGIIIDCYYKNGSEKAALTFHSPSSEMRSYKFFKSILELCFKKFYAQPSIDALELTETYFGFFKPWRITKKFPLTLRIYGSLSISHKEALEKELNELPKNQSLLIDARNLKGMGTILYESFISFIEKQPLVEWLVSKHNEWLQKQLNEMGIKDFRIKYDETELGMFQEFWDGQPNHLPFLDLRDDAENNEWNLEISLRKIDEICNNHYKADVLSELSLLINKNNWRPQLLFCIALLKLEKDDQLEFTGYLWDKLEENSSFVIPQLTVTVSIIDPDFHENAILFLQKKDENKSYEGLNNEDLLAELRKDALKLDDKTEIVIGWNERIKELLNQQRITKAKFKTI